MDATSNHGPCAGCGQPVLQREYSGDGVVKLFDDAKQDYAPWHPECGRLARGAQAGSLLPTPPRTRWRAAPTNGRHQRRADRNGAPAEPGRHSWGRFAPQVAYFALQLSEQTSRRPASRPLERRTAVAGARGGQRLGT